MPKKAGSPAVPNEQPKPPRKRFMSWVMPSGQEMARRLPEHEVEGFTEFLKEHGAKEIVVE